MPEKDSSNNTKQPPLTKQEVYAQGMKGDHVVVHLDSRKDGVVVPAHLMNNYALSLKLSYLFQGETREDEQAITTYLKFSGEYQQCVIPWSAIWGITDSENKNQLWPKDLPPEVVRELALNKLKELKDRFFSKKDKQTTEENTPNDKDQHNKSLAGKTKRKGVELKRIK